MRFASTCPERRRRAPQTWWLALALAIGLTTVHSQDADPPGAAVPRGSAPVFHARTDLVVLQVSVIDSQHRFVSDLGAADFAIYEDGQRQDVATFVSTIAPLDLMVLLDTSSSMGPHLSLVQRAATNLIRTLKPHDRTALVVFHDTVRVAHALTGNVRGVESTIQDTVARGSTALYDAVYVSLHELARAQRAAEPNRQAVVVLSDGEDTRSRTAFDDVLEQARRSAVTIFTIMPSPPPNRAGLSQRIRFEMRQLAEVTGGRAFAPTGFDGLEPIYHEIATELGQQYWLGYVPASAAREGFRRVSVRVETRPGLRARTRSGYYAGGADLHTPPTARSNPAR